MNIRKGAYVSCILLMLLLSPITERIALGAEEKINLDFKEIELPALIQTISELTGKNFIYDDSVKGKVTIISPSEVSLDEAYNLFLTVLNVKGYTVVPSGKANKIIQVRDAKESSLPITTQQTGGEQYVTRLIPLKNVDATLMATSVLAPLIPKSSNIVAYTPTNTLIVTDSATNIERLVKIVRELDIASSLEALETISLQFATADDVALVLNQVFAQNAATPRRSRTNKGVSAAGSAEAPKIIPYSRNNTLVVAATVEDIAIIRSLVSELDQKPTQNQDRSHINVYYLENADAETLAKTLTDMVAGISSHADKQQQNTSVPSTVSITADVPTNSLVINATPPDYEMLKAIISQLDIKRKQVYVEALIMELSMDATQSLGMSLQGAVSVGDGVSYFSTGTSAVSPLLEDDDTGVSSILSSAVSGIMMGGLFNPITITDPTDSSSTITIPALSALINLSKANTDVNILSAPRLLTSDNEEAEIIVGANVPMITSRLTDSTNTSSQSVSVERKDVALTLRFTPQITEGRQVRLEVYQEITALVDSSSSQSVGTVDEVGPTLTKRLLRNTVIAEDGKTVVLGGLIRNNQSESISKVPFLGDIPILGWLFKTKSTTDEKTNLLIFITPKIIRNGDDLDDVTSDASKAMDTSRVGDVASDTVIENLKSAPTVETGN